MKIYYVDRVIIKSMNPDGTFRAISKTGGPPFDRCYFVWENPNNASQEQLGKRQDLSTLFQGHLRQRQRSAEVVIRLAGLDEKLKAGGSHNKNRASSYILK